MFFCDFGLIRDINKTVAIDLRQTLEEQRANFGRI
jgi:hypothetical protein